MTDQKIKTPFIQLLQFSMIGMINGLIDIGVFNGFLLIKPTTAAYTLILYNSAAYVLAVLNSYIWNSKITFSNYSRRTKREVLLFFIQAAISLGISNGVLLLSFRFGTLQQLPILLYQNISKAAAMLLSSLTSFFLMKYIVFSNKKQHLH